MWRIKMAGLATGFAITCASYYRIFALGMLEARAAHEKRFASIEEQLLVAARDAVKAAPAELNVGVQAAPTPPSQ
ncbi:hypothetical protein LSCM1_01898 [Leishmania martiniquensis]|uniref:Uncharacterized protein n=1 Tax=Leishmania martiniquensis TaxID=1580590 RepID=A0A836FWL4_9TRYP|nr:hypothetical protein LSCM1_01898 [Leishmania martiniquensis]